MWERFEQVAGVIAHDYKAAAVCSLMLQQVLTTAALYKLLLSRRDREFSQPFSFRADGKAGPQIGKQAQPAHAREGGKREKKKEKKSNGSSAANCECFYPDKDMGCAKSSMSVYSGAMMSVDGTVAL